MNTTLALWVIGSVAGITLITYGIARYMAYRERRANARERLHPGGGPDPRDTIPNRAEREEAQRRYDWLLENPGEIPPWDLPTPPKNTPPKKAA